MTSAIVVHDHEGIDFSPNPQEEIKFKVTGDNTDGLFDYFDLRVGYLQGFQLHIHLEQYETFHVVEGELLLQNADEWIVAKQGDFTLIPKGTVHTYVNVRRTVAHSIGIISPGGFDKFVSEMREVVMAAARSCRPEEDRRAGRQVQAEADWADPRRRPRPEPRARQEGGHREGAGYAPGHLDSRGQRGSR